MLQILEWTGTILILAGILFLASKRASNPKTRIKGLLTTIIGCIFLGTFAIISGLWGVLATQTGVTIINIYGIYNCLKEIKNDLPT